MKSKPRRAKVIIIQETSPEKYFPAIEALERSGSIEVSGRYRYSVVRRWLWAWRRARLPFAQRTREAWNDLVFRLRLPSIQGHAIIFAFAPWDWRLLIYRQLGRKNKLIHHTSWPRWEERQVPRQYGFLTPLLRAVWTRHMRDPEVEIVTVLAAGRDEISRRYGREPRVIPHAVPEMFYEAASSCVEAVVPDAQSHAMRLIFVGELSQQKGIAELLALYSSLKADISVELTVIGDGPLRSVVEGAARDQGVRYLGRVSDRKQLAVELARHDILVLLSQRSPTWEELFGVVIIEAMAAGLGVIASDHIGPRSIFSGSGLANVFSEKDLAGAHDLLARLFMSPAALIEFRRRHSLLAEAYRSSFVERAWLDLLVDIASAAA